MKQTVLVTGAGGQLGRELILMAPEDIECIAVGHHELDIGDPAAIVGWMKKCKPQVVINAAAYTAVDRAEEEPAQALRVNGEGPGHLASACVEHGARMIHISTDFVFDGQATSPYLPASSPSPVSEYGRGKLAGEHAVREIMPEAIIVRTSWVYSRFGANFVKTMLRLMSERDELGVVFDQIGTPTWARGLAQVLWVAAARPQLQGTYHWSDAGICSWYDFAQAIYEEGRALGLLQRDVIIKPIPGSSYPTPATRPSYSVLDKSSCVRDFGVEAEPWRDQLRAMLLDMKAHEND